MHGKPALEKGFLHFPYVNPDAPKGGRLTLANSGGFTSLNPYVLKGSAPWPVRSLTVESLMARSYDEPFTLYGLLAESVETPPDRSWVAFTLRENARFSDGSTVTVEDVIWSFKTLGTEGHPRYRKAWAGVSKIEATGPRTVRIDFSVKNRELPLIMGLRPILKKAQFDGKDFAGSGQEQVIGSGPYLIEGHEFGRQITFRRNPDYWGADLAVNKGLHNFDEIRFDYFRNDEALWEAVKTGQISIFLDGDPARWEDGYDLEIFSSGKMQRTEVLHRRPSGMEGFVFNTRRAIFADRRVREALALTFDWEWVNDRLFRGAYSRIQSYFGGSSLGFDAAAGPGEQAVLEPFAGSLPPGTIEEGWRPPVSDGTGRDRKNLRKAGRLLDQAGWTVQDGVRRNADGAEFRFEILVAGERNRQLASLWRESLSRLGVVADVRAVDDTQYQSRRDEYDFDMIVYRWGMSLSPGNEQRFYFDGSGREQPGTRNYMGVDDPAVNATIDALLAATEREAFQDAVRALDRALMSGIYVIPFGVLPGERITWIEGIKGPDIPLLYGWWGWWGGPARWWAEP
ncbi:MAG: extracellular solute-binding protein [Pseudomonadota bacterium]